MHCRTASRIKGMTGKDRCGDPGKDKKSEKVLLSRWFIRAAGMSGPAPSAG